MNSPLTENSRPEKALWYQEVLSLDPASRIFLPYARLLAENGRRMEAIEVLRAGLSRHPEFLDARLLLIEQLHAAGQDAAAGLEAAGIIESLSRCSALWDIWSKLPGVRPDQAAMLHFFGATFRRGGPTLADVFEAGMKALREAEGTDSPEPQDEPSSGDENNASARSAEEAPAPSESSAPEAAAASSASPSVAGPADAGTSAAAPRCFVMDENTPWYGLDSVPDDDDLDDADENAPAPLPAPSVTDLFFAGSAAPSERHGQDEQVPAAHPVPRSVMEGKSSLCTRSMARILEEQGATGEAASIYRELLEVSSSPEERAELNAKLDSLMQGAENPAPEQPADSGLLNMLETLAVRLENKSRA